jgi:hypothetical protein
MSWSSEAKDGFTTAPMETKNSREVPHPLNLGGSTVSTPSAADQTEARLNSAGIAASRAAGDLYFRPRLGPLSPLNKRSRRFELGLVDRHVRYLRLEGQQKTGLIAQLSFDNASAANDSSPMLVKSHCL